jgi:hypothetical protein
MARIPIGNFGEGGGTAPLVRTRVQGGDDPVAQALGGIADTGMRMAAAEQNRQQAEADALARAKAQNAILDDEIEQRSIVSDIERRIGDGTLPYSEAMGELNQVLAKREAPTIEGLDPVDTENFTRGLERNQFGSSKVVEGLVETARRADFKGQIAGARDRLGKIASDPNADVDGLVKGGAELQGLAEMGGIAGTFAKDQQDFADRVYKDNASARLVAGRDSMEALDQLERDLTQDGGRYTGKLDASATNTLLAQVQARKAQLEAKAETASRKGEAAAQRVLDQQEAQVASTLQAPIDVMQERTATIAQFGTPEQKAQWADLLESEVQVRQLLAKPPAEQRAALVQMQAQQRTEGATVQQQAHLKRLESAVNTNLKDLAEQPLVAYQRITGSSVEPLDLQGMLTGDGATLQAQMAAREDTLRAMRNQYGPEVGNSILLPQEAAQLSAMVDKASPAQASQLYGILSRTFTNPAAYRAAMQQIAPDSPVRAFAGMVFAEQRSTTLKAGGIFRGAVKASAGDVARTILEGEALLNPAKAGAGADGKGGKFPMPTPVELNTKMEDFVGNAFAGRPEAYAVAQQAVRAYYAGASAKAGDVKGELDEARVSEAVRAVLGETVDFNGQDVFPPWGMDEPEFTQALEDRWPSITQSLPPQVSRDLDDYQLRPGAGSRYYVVGPNGLFLTDAAGNPVQIDVRAPLGSAAGGAAP